ncbi:hypothetical protein DYB36_011428 [Aphanomyces astaci]|uniref:PH domain-containing protein n=1 Tax=Aphanomyces astaci TaxID=112090 RepID=A0A397BK74_APHAT|nr:hypothetical protein DYB36_011428 [Aphanomyces astaci]
MPPTPLSFHDAATSRSLSSRAPAKSLDEASISVAERAKLVRQHGYLLKKTLFRGLRAQYYSINCYSAKLHCFADYNDYNMWNSQGQPQDSLSSNSPGGKKVVTPLRKHHILAVDEDTSTKWKLVLTIRKTNSMSGKTDKMVLIAESADEFSDWIDAFHDVLQCTSFRERSSHAKSWVESITASARHSLFRPLQQVDGSSRSYCAPNTPTGVSSPLTSRSSRHRHAGPSLSASTPPSHDHPFSSSKTLPLQQRNIVLLGAANGSTMHVSESKLARAKYELDQLLAEPGTVRPYRGLVEDDSTCSVHPLLPTDDSTEWLHGRPDYTLTDLAYLKGRSRFHDPHSVATTLETALRIFVMDVAHKPIVSQWQSIALPTFRFQCNDNAPLCGPEALAGLRHSLLGLVATSSMDRVADVFGAGCPLEVLHVYTTSPSFYFAWRQWGAFTGTFDGRRGNGDIVQVTGFGHMLLDMEGCHMHSLHLFCHDNALEHALQSICAVSST